MVQNVSVHKETDPQNTVQIPYPQKSIPGLNQQINLHPIKLKIVIEPQQEVYHAEFDHPWRSVQSRG